MPIILYSAGTDVGDHPPITPMRSATMAELGSENFRLYDFIVRYFIGTVSRSPFYSKEFELCREVFCKRVFKVLTKLNYVNETLTEYLL